MKNLKYLIILNTIFNLAQLIQSDDELLELNCSNETQCKQFQHSGMESLCIEEQCRCTTTNGENVKCQPLNPKVNNIIGGTCPCNQPNTDCDIKQDVCYCVSDYMPSSDKRRCIPKMVALDQKCEQDSQCQKFDFNSICHESKICKCKEYFANNNGKCASIVGNIRVLSSFNASQCLQLHNTKYINITQQCICMPGYFASLDNSKCLETQKYLDPCSENMQCIGAMGPGGICLEHFCQCSERYFVEEKKTEEGVIKTVCTAIVERGQYCRYDEDCYQRQLNESQQSMECTYDECNCKKGYYSYNNGDCTKGSGADIKSFMKIQLALVLLVFVNIYFS